MDFDKKILKNFENGKYSPTEYRQVSSWFEQDDHPQLKDSMQGRWTELPADQPLDEKLIRLLENLKMQLAFPARPASWLRFYQRVAAVLFIPLMLGFGGWIFFSQKEQSQTALASIHAPEGARIEFSLPDGTTGWLNSGSKLTYPVDFADRREVEIHGEAYFNVVHQRGEDFLVHANELVVRVLGTSFNVAAYDNDPEISVILKEGKVNIQKPDGEKMAEMSPNEKFEFNAGKKLARISKVDAKEQTAWINGLLQFRGEPLSEVMKKLARWYNVDFEIRDEKLKNYNFKATFKDEQLDEILRMIALTTPMKYRIEERKLSTNGIYMKRKIIIEKS